jgi:hypothetical protein
LAPSNYDAAMSNGVLGASPIKMPKEPDRKQVGFDARN